MRACFLGQNVTALGFGVAMLQTPPQAAEPPLESQWPSHLEPEREAKTADDTPQNAPEPPQPPKATAPQAA